MNLCRRVFWCHCDESAAGTPWTLRLIFIVFDFCSMAIFEDLCAHYLRRSNLSYCTRNNSNTMARRYDSSTTTFSPEGRLHQVEYAIEAINNAGTSVGILAKDGVVMASERKITSGLLAPARVS